MTLHFTCEEFAARHERALAAMAARGLDGLLMFKQRTTRRNPARKRVWPST
jgi:hypothetical protein